MEGLIKCPLCDVSYANKANLLLHVDKHDGFPLSCIKCLSAFKNKFSFDFHLTNGLCKKRDKPKGPLWQCQECPQAFPYRRHIDKHVEGHMRNGCNYCEVRLTTRKELTLHMAQEHSMKLEKQKYKCNFCDRSFVKQVSLFSHHNVHANGKFVCQGCGVFLNTEEELKSHREKHELERPWKCVRCATTFSRRQQYLVHLESHEKYSCNTCNMGFAAKATLQEHVRDCPNFSGEEQRFQCHECNEIFSQKSRLELHIGTHIATHTSEDFYTCLLCNNRFETLDEYNWHVNVKCQLKTHYKHQPHACDQCNKRFPHDFLLVEHKQQMHGALPVYRCNFCEQISNSRAKMARHLALHTKGRCFVCEQCGAAFHAKYTLKDHYASVHSEQRQFSCPICSKAFKLQTDLKRHIRSHSDTRPFKCQNCDFSYKRASHLKRHEEKAHGTVFRSRRPQRRGKDETGSTSVVPISDLIESSGSKLQEQQELHHYSDPSSSQVFSAPVLTLMDTDNCNVVTLQELCPNTQILTATSVPTAEIFSLPSEEQQVTALVSCSNTEEAQILSATNMPATEILSLPTEEQHVATLVSCPNSENSQILALPANVCNAEVLSLPPEEQHLTTLVSCPDPGDPQILTAANVVNVSPAEVLQLHPEEQQLISSADPALNNYQPTEMMPAVVTYASHPITTALANEPQLVFTTPIAMSVDPNQTVLAVSQLQPTEGLVTDISKLPGTIFMGNNSEGPMLLDSAETMPHVAVENFTPLSSNVGEVMQVDSMVQLPDDVLTSESILRNQLMTGPNFQLCDNMSSITIASNLEDVTTLPVAITKPSSLISLPTSVGSYSDSMVQATVMSASENSATETILNSSKSPLPDYFPAPEEVSAVPVTDPMACSMLEEGDRTAVTLLNLPVHQEVSESDSYTALSSLSVDAFDMNHVGNQTYSSCTIQPQDSSTGDLVIASLGMHPDFSEMQEKETAVTSANLMAEFLPQNYTYLNVK